MRTALIVSVAIAAVPAAAAELPVSFHGTWRIANPAGNECRRVETGDAPEGHMVVRPGVVAQYESSCRIASARPTRKPDAERASVFANLVCEGEGMRWRSRALFHLETVDGRKLVAVTTLNHSGAGAMRGSPVNLPTTTVYTECR